MDTGFEYDGRVFRSLSAIATEVAGTRWNGYGFFGLLYGVPALSRRIDEVVAQLDLARFRDVKCGVLSSGEQTRVTLAKALLNRPRLLLLDEPTAGMSDQETYGIAELVRRVHEERHLTTILIEHDMRVIFHLADRITVLAEGATLADGTPAEIGGNESVQAAYLGSAR